MKIYAVLAAGGSGSRMESDVNKIFLPVGGKPVLARSIALFNGLADGMVIVCRPEDMPEVNRIAASAAVSFPVSVVSGGITRQESVKNGLEALRADEGDIVLIHDAARCLTPVSVIRNVVESCIRYGSGIPGIHAVNTIKVSEDGKTVARTVDRSNLYEIQTPQGFRYGALSRAYRKASEERFSATDDASVAEHCGITVHLVEGSGKNIKITRKEDLVIVNALLQNGLPSLRIGTGYDVHRFAEGRRLILCGVEISHTLGLLGHSDADVALHALMDAMLGAASLGDIGKHFPDSDEKYKGISSLLLLRETAGIVKKAGFRFVNADLTIVAQKPKLAAFVPDMVRNISSALECDPSRVSVKATTTEKLGFEGREEGISAQAVCMLDKIP